MVGCESTPPLLKGGAMNIAFIPARKGSKGIPGKNKKLFCGKPLVQWSIEQAKDSKLFDDIVVSSDDEDILKLAKSLGVTPVKRKDELAEDDTKLDDVVWDYIQDHPCDYICLLQPTSPLRSVKDIKRGYKYIQMKKYWSVVGVTWNPIMGWVDNATNKGPACIYLVNDRPNRQNRENFFLENGAIYWTEYSTFLNLKSRIGSPAKTKLLEMPPERSLEVDSPFDWYLAEKAKVFTA